MHATYWDESTGKATSKVPHFAEPEVGRKVEVYKGFSITDDIPNTPAVANYVSKLAASFFTRPRKVRTAGNRAGRQGKSKAASSRTWSHTWQEWTHELAGPFACPLCEELHTDPKEHHRHVLSHA